MTINYSQVQIHIARTGLSSKDRAIQKGPGYPARTGLASNSKDAGLASKDWESLEKPG